MFYNEDEDADATLYPNDRRGDTDDDECKYQLYTDSLGACAVLCVDIINSSNLTDVTDLRVCTS